MKFWSRRRGFSLLELMCVVAIIASLLILTFPIVHLTIKRFSKLKLTSQAHLIGKGGVKYFEDIPLESRRKTMMPFDMGWWVSELRPYNVPDSAWYLGPIESHRIGKDPPDYIWGGLTPKHYFYGGDPMSRRMFVGLESVFDSRLVVIFGDGSVGFDAP